MVVLIAVEDANESSVLANAITKAFGASVTVKEAGDGVDATVFVKTGHVDAVIADNGILGFSGYNLLAEIRTFLQKKTPFLLRSVSSWDGLREEVEKLDATFLQKLHGETTPPDTMVTWLREKLGL